MVRGNLISLAIYNAAILWAAIYINSWEMYAVCGINAIILFYQGDKQKQRNDELNSINNRMDLIQKKAKENIERKHQNDLLSEISKKDLVRQEFIRLIIEKE